MPLGMPRCGYGYKAGAGSRNRTRDLLITNQLLYHLSYAGTYKIIADRHASLEHACAVIRIE